MLHGIAAFWYFFPIMLVLYSFGGGLLVRLLGKRSSLARDYSYVPFVSVLLPVFNEGPHVLETIKSIMDCDWPKDRLEIIAVDDKSGDDSFFWVKQAAGLWPNVKAFQNPVNAGKHVSLSRALGHSKGEILLCIDSDCIFDKNVIRELVCCFADPKVGAVGGSIGITNVNANFFTVCQTLVYFVSFQVGKAVQNLTGHVFCISGCLFAVRRPLFEAVEHEVKSRNWFGINVRDGEDRYMTHAILMRGWKTILNPAAVCWTAAPEKLAQLFSQQIRWRRSGLRDLFWTWVRIPQHFRVIGFWPLMAALIPESFTAMWALLLVAALITGGIAESMVTVVQAVFGFSGVFISAAMIYNLTCQKAAQGNQKIDQVLMAGVAGAWFFMDALVITLLALFTFDVGAWGTREKTAGADAPAADPIVPATAIGQHAPAHPTLAGAGAAAAAASSDHELFLTATAETV